MPGAARPSEPAQPHIQCCFQGCVNPANVRLWTAAGWVNVCAYVGLGDKETFHYTKVKTVPRITHNPVMDALREAYKKSAAYRQHHLPIISKERYQRILEDSPRTPGEDD